jgi:hypothetical protein
MRSTIFLSCFIYALCSALSAQPERTSTSKPQVNVQLKLVLDGINLPTVIKSAVLPEDTEESLFVTTQPGEIWVVNQGKARKILDISFNTTGDVLKLGHVQGSQDPTYDERGLLGIEFHPQFRTNGRFFLYYSTDDHTPKLSTKPFSPAPDPCNPKTSNMHWSNQNQYDHVNVVEEWRYIPSTGPKRVRRLLSIKHPFFNHNSINNLFWSTELNKLLVLTGDGGFRDGPFNLSQDDEFFHGKVIAIDVDSRAWRLFRPKPVARLKELPRTIRKTLEIVIKGVRNWSGMVEFRTGNSSIKFFGQPGQDSVEALYALKDFVSYNHEGKKQPINIGWRGWEGSFPSLQNLECGSQQFTLKMGDFKNLTYYQEAVNLATARKIPYCEYYHQDNRPGKVQAVSITSHQVYRGTEIAGLTDNVIIADWAHNSGVGFSDGQPLSPGFLIHVPIDNKLDKLHDYQEIKIIHEFTKPAFFVSLGSSLGQTRLFLGTYRTTGTTEPHLGTVFEIIPASNTIIKNGAQE